MYTYKKADIFKEGITTYNPAHCIELNIIKHCSEERSVNTDDGVNCPFMSRRLHPVNGRSLRTIVSCSPPTYTVCMIYEGRTRPNGFSSPIYLTIYLLKKTKMSYLKRPTQLPWTLTVVVVTNMFIKGTKNI